MNIFLLFSICMSDGLYYEDENHSILTGAVFGTVSVKIESTVKSIKGGSKETDGFAYSIRSTLNNVDFSDATSLKIIEGYAFTSTRLLIINLSSCVSLDKISDSAFLYCTAETLLLPQNGALKTLGFFCFGGLKLSDVLIPSSIEKIEMNVFYNIYSLLTCTIAPYSNLSSVGVTAFQATKISSFRIPKSATSIHSTAFADCMNLVDFSVELGSSSYASENGVLYTYDYKSLVIFPPGLLINQNYSIKYGVEKILYESFRSCQISGIICSSTVSIIEEKAFMSCRNLRYFEISNSITTFGIYCFWNTKIESLVVPTNVSTLSSFMFSGCSSLTNVTFHPGVKVIQSYCFQGCKSLTVFDVHDGVTHIGDSAFKDCSMLRIVWLPQTIESLGGGLFEGCNENIEVRFRNKGKFDTDYQFIIYADNKTVVIQMYTTPSNPNIILPDSVVSISNGAFASSNLVSILLNSGLNHIGSRAFAECMKLKELVMPNSVDSIGDGIFSDSLIQKVTLGNISKIPTNAFSNTIITEIKIPYSVNSILGYSFYKSMLMKIEFLPNSSLKSISSNAFADCLFLDEITLPRSLDKISSGAFSGKSVVSIIFENGSLLTSIPYGAFMGSSRLASVSFSNTTTVLGSFSFSSCLSLENITLSAGIKQLEDSCLSGCKNLRSIIIQNNSALEYISNSALDGLYNLESIVILGNCVGFASSSDFAILYNKDYSSIIKYCCKSNRLSFDIPNTINSFAWCCFEGAESLVSVSIPSSITEISFRAFAGCKNLKSLIINESVEEVGSMAFEGCSSLECGSVKYPKAIREKLKSAGIPEKALDKCITPIFSIRQEREKRAVSIDILCSAQTLILNE